MEKFDAALAEIATKVAQLAEKHGPDAIALAGTVLQLQYASSLLWPLFLAAVAVGLAVVCVRASRAAAAAKLEDEVPPIMCAVVTGLGTVITGAVAVLGICSNVLSPLVWAAAFNPNVAIAAKVLGSLK
jgi:hypothetical protein